MTVRCYFVDLQVSESDLLRRLRTDGSDQRDCVDGSAALGRHRVPLRKLKRDTERRVGAVTVHTAGVLCKLNRRKPCARLSAFAAFDATAVYVCVFV